VVAAVLEERALEVRRTVEHLLTAAATGDRAAAQSLLPWIDQALGRPTERVEQTQTRTIEDVRALDPASLQALVAEGRAARLRAVE
jgi:ribosomal protein L17